MEIKLLLLDFDGTVANTGRANATSYIEALAEQGITITMEEYRQKYYNHNGGVSPEIFWTPMP